MQQYDEEGYEIIFQPKTPVRHKIDDLPGTKLKKVALLYMNGEVGDIKVQGPTGDAYILRDFSGEIWVRVIKIWKTGTNVDTDKILLLR